MPSQLLITHDAATLIRAVADLQQYPELLQKIREQQEQDIVQATKPSPQQETQLLNEENRTHSTAIEAH
jgi:ribosome-associated toxin RatA of RatAB toxin-antitoxin module